MKKAYALLLACLLATTPVMAAEEDEAPAKKRLKAEAELSYVDTSGNSEVTTLSAKNKMTYDFTDTLSGTWKMSALNSKSEGERSNESYASELRLDYALSAKAFTGFLAGWKKDRYAFLDAQYYGGVFVGYNFFDGPAHFVKSEAGLDYVSDKFYDDPDTPLIDESKTDRDYVRGRVFSLYEYHINEKTKFSQSVEYLHDFDESENYNINTVTAFITALSDILSLKTSYEVQYDHMPASATADDTDTIFSVALLLSY